MPQLPFEPLAIRAAVAGAAAVVHVEHGKAAARPVLNREVERAGARGGRAAVAHDEQRRRFVRRRGVVAILRRIEIPMRRQAVFGWEFDCARFGKIAGIDIAVSRDRRSTSHFSRRQIQS